MLITTCYKRKRRDEKEIRFGWRRSRRRVSGLPLRGKLLSFLKLLQCSLEISDKLCIFYFLTRLKYQSWRITIRSIILYITYKIVRPNWERLRERRTLTEISWSESLKALSLAEVSLTNCSIRCLVVCLKILKKKKNETEIERDMSGKERERGLTASDGEEECPWRFRWRRRGGGKRRRRCWSGKWRQPQPAMGFAAAIERQLTTMASANPGNSFFFFLF